MENIENQRVTFRVLTTHEINFPSCGFVDGNCFSCYCVPDECAAPHHPAHSGCCKFYKKVNGYNVCTRVKPVQLTISFGL